MRLDSALVQRGIVSSRERAKDAIKTGYVFVNGVPAAKPSSPIAAGDAIEVRGELLRYVGRGGLKLEKALEVFGIDVRGKTCVDVGASTGGFTDCMLQAGAACVFAVDVGHGQLASSLRDDARVVDLEGIDAREMNEDLLGTLVQFAATDVSFISLEKVLPAMSRVLEVGAPAVCLVKPQFEAGRENVGKKGVVRSSEVHERVLLQVMGYARHAGFVAIGIDFSPITGPEGNIEYLLYLRKGDALQPDSHENQALNVRKVVEHAHAVLS